MPYTAEFEGAEVMPLHLMVGVASSPTGRWAEALSSLGVDRDELHARLVSLAGEGGLSGDPEAMAYSDGAKGALTAALRVCRDARTITVGSEHIFLGALEQASAEVTADLAVLGVTAEAYRTALSKLPS